MIHPLAFLKGAGLGAGMMYFFDPAAGDRRRAAISEQLVDACSLCNKAGDQLQGVASEVRQSMGDPDAPLSERVQHGMADLGRTLSAPSSWSPAMRTAAMIGGAGLVAGLMSKRDVAALALGVVGLSMVAKQIANEEQKGSSKPQRRAGNAPDQEKARGTREDKPAKKQTSA